MEKNFEKITNEIYYKILEYIVANNNCSIHEIGKSLGISASSLYFEQLSLQI
jgi:hypothetical protein